MLKAEYDMETGRGEVAFEGNLMTIALEIGRIIREVYNSIGEENLEDAKTFREGFCEMIKEESGIVWDLSNGEKSFIKKMASGNFS